MADPYITPQAPQQGQLFGPSQDRRTTLLQLARLDPALTPEQKAQLVTWLQGQAPLTDPALYAWVTRGGQTASIPGAGPVHVPQATQATPVPAVPSSNPPGAPQSVAGTGQATGAQAAGGLYQNYIANQQKAASRPIAENPVTGPNAGDNVTPAPPVTAATTPNATNPTAPNPAPAPTGGSTMATPPPVPSGNPNDLATVSGAALVGGTADQGAQLREALRQAGYDPDHLGLGGQFFAKLIQPTLAAEASVYGFGNPGGADPTKAQDFIGNLVRSFTTRGVNGAAQAAQYAQGIMGNPAFQQTLGDLPNDQQRQQVLQNLAGLVYGNRSSLEQSAAAANFDRALSQFQDAGYGLGGVADRYQGNFSQWLTGTPAGQRLARMIGLGG